jgi:hypothetical protein
MKLTILFARGIYTTAFPTSRIHDTGSADSVFAQQQLTYITHRHYVCYFTKISLIGLEQRDIENNVTDCWNATRQVERNSIVAKILRMDVHVRVLMHDTDSRSWPRP